MMQAYVDKDWLEFTKDLVYVSEDEEGDDDSVDEEGGEDEEGDGGGEIPPGYTTNLKESADTNNATIQFTNDENAKKPLQPQDDDQYK
jgi:hypothetical protein